MKVAYIIFVVHLSRTELSHVVQERAEGPKAPSPLPFPSAGDRWFRACGAYMRNLSLGIIPVIFVIKTKLAHIWMAMRTTNRKLAIN